MWQGISINTGSMDINPNRFTWTDVNVFESNGIPRQNLLGVEIELFTVRKSNPGDSILGEKKLEIFFIFELKSRWKCETPSTNLSIVPGMPCSVYHWSDIFLAISAILSPMGNDALYLSRSRIECNLAERPYFFPPKPELT